MNSITVLPMPQYRSHKVVGALKIKEVITFFHIPEQRVVLVFEDASIPSQEVDVINRPRPEPGWYFVRYPDGYYSFSPAEQFEQGYSLVD